MNQKNFVIRLKYEEWKNHLSKVKLNSARQRLLVDFHNRLSYELQNTYGVKCCLKNWYNWFNNKIYWTALYKCIFNDCKVTYYCYISTEPKKNEDVLIIVEKNGESDHEKILKKRRIVDEERAELGLKLMGQGISNIIDENVIFNNENDCEDDFYKS